VTIALLGVRVTDATRPEAVELMDGWIRSRDGRSRAVFIVNAHTLNLAWEDPVYRAVLNGADVVFADGSGARLAARLRGVRLRDNLVGTDLVPFLADATQARGYGYYLLGGAPGTAARAAAWFAEQFPGVRIAGHHHGYVDPRQSDALVASISAAGADVLLVGMGNPIQERWIADHLPALHVPVCLGVGGLFDHWAGRLHRAPRWVRALGMEWVQLLLQQPHKWRRYLLGNPKFVARALGSARAESTAR
jgi:N-acetylglucosaminyldiphosphoundecaprenol N-acetyl-beta-D-mannosaminyltransferase